MCCDLEVATRTQLFYTMQMTLLDVFSTKESDGIVQGWLKALSHRLNLLLS